MEFGRVDEGTRAYDLQEAWLDLGVLDLHCVTWAVGPFKIEACVDLSVPEASVSASLLGVKIGACTFGASNCCTVGGSIGGFKAVAKICLESDPLRIVIDAELCRPLAGCKKYHVEIPIPIGEDVE